MTREEIGVTLLLALGLMFLAGCSGLKVHGECTYVREVKTTYQCQPDGKAEHYRLASTDPQ